ncbi:MAG: universal stress protein, partial [Planctomycetota bacterium]
MPIRSILVKIDGSGSSHIAAELALEWAVRFRARIKGISVFDEERYLIPYAEEPPGLYEQRLKELEAAKTAAEAALEQLSSQCAERGILCEVCQETGRFREAVLKEIQRHDVVLLGRHLHASTIDDPSGRITRLLRDSCRPVVLVPEALPREENTLLAYNGSPSSARVLATLVASGLLDTGRTIVAGVDETVEQAQARIAPALDYLAIHEIPAEGLAISSRAPVHDELVEQVAKRDVGLLAAGAFGRSRT